MVEPAKNNIKKRMVIMLTCLAILFGLVAGYKAFKGWMIAKYMASMTNIVHVSALKVDYQSWQTQLKYVGSLRAILGVNVTTELAGMVQTINFTPGASIQKDAVLVQLNADAEIAQLHSLQANAEYAKITYTRDKAQYEIKAVSKSTLDSDEASLKSLNAQVEQQAAIVAKKSIRAPFTGRLGISYTNPGQYLNPGDKVTTLQTMDPIYLDFYVPQQSMAKIAVGQTVKVTTETFPNQIYTGTITTINPAVDTNTRNVEVEATISNPKMELTPGMFATLVIDAGAPEKYLTVPQTAISFNPYGDIVFVLKPNDKNKNAKDSYVAQQVFVTVGERRGDQIAILDGIKKDDIVVTAGQLKLKNGAEVTINNTTTPSNNPTPAVKEDF